MSSLDQRPRRIALLALALMPTLMLGGCFRPMYATPADGGPALTEKLAAISVDLTDSRVGQQVRNNLTFGLTGGGGPAAPRYNLHLRVVSTLDTAIVNSRINTPEIDVVILSGTYTLTPANGSNLVLLEGKAYARKSYDRGLQRFAAVRAGRDAENAAATVLADQLKTRLAIFLSSHP